jgi:hypothetical protein
MVYFFSRFFATQKVCFLLTLKEKLHLISIENTAVKNRMESNKKNIGWQCSNERKSRQRALLRYFSFELSFTTVCAVTEVLLY